MTEQKTDPFAIEIEDLTIAYQDKPVVWDLDLKIPKGTMTAIVGPNGAGKSTLVKAIMKLVPLVSGDIKIFNQPFQARKQMIAYVPQRSQLDWDFPTNILDVVTMGTYGDLGWFKRPGKKEKQRALLAIEKVGLEGLENRPIGELSGGQQQRVLVARSLVQNSDIYILDEPFQGVDAPTERAIIKVLNDLKTEGKTLLIVHHDLQTVKEYFDWAVIINVRAIAYGPVNDIFNFENLKLAYGGQIGGFTPTEPREYL